MILNKTAMIATIGYQSISQKLTSARFRTKFAKMTVIQAMCQRPHSAATNEKIDTFHEQLQQIIHGIPRHDIIAHAGDFNAKVGRESDTWRGTIGKFGRGDMNNSREKKSLEKYS